MAIANYYDQTTGQYLPLTMLSVVGGSEPEEFIKSASVSGNKLTLVRKTAAGTTDIVYEPDVIVQGYYNGTNFYKEATHTTLITPSVKSLYIDLTSSATDGCVAYYYNGTAYVNICKLTNFVPSTRSIAGNTLANDITTTQLQTSLGLGTLAYKNSAAGVGTAQTITGVKATGALTSTSTITGALGSDEQEATVSVWTDYTPVGTIEVALKDNTISEITDVGALPTFTEGTFTTNTPTVVDTTKFSGGSLSAETKEKFAQKILKATHDDTSDTLTFEYVDSTDTTLAANFNDAVTAQGTLTPAQIQTGFYTAGVAATKAADTFTQGSLPTKADKTVLVDTDVTKTKFTGSTSTDLIPGTIKYNKTTIGTLGVNTTTATPADGLSVGDIAVDAQNVTVNFS